TSTAWPRRATSTSRSSRRFWPTTPAPPPAPWRSTSVPATNTGAGRFPPPAPPTRCPGERRIPMKASTPLSIRGLLALLFALSSCHLGTLSSARAGDKLQYNRDVRPILAENCFPCHGPDSAARKAGLRLDQRDHALKKEAFVPGDPDNSELV